MDNNIDLSDFLDDYGFNSDIYRVLYSSNYIELSFEEKREVLLKLIDINHHRNNSEIIKRLSGEGKLSIKNKYEDKDAPKDIDRCFKKKNFDLKSPNLSGLFHVTTIDDIRNLGLLPKNGSVDEDKKIKQLILAIHRELEEYKLLELSEDLDVFADEKDKLENVLELLIDYSSYEDEDVEIEVQSDFSVYYLPNNLFFSEENNSSPLIKDLSKNKRQDILISMIDSIKAQEFRGIKRFSNHFSDFYELRCGQQRVVFHFLTPKDCVIIFAFTKKADNEKRYRMELSNRIHKYRRMKNKLKKVLCEEEFLSKQSEIDESIYKVVQKNKTLVKENKEGDNNG